MRLLISILLYSSSVSYAAVCPDLQSETKICRSTTGQLPGNEKQVITQEVINGVTVYTLTYTPLNTDESVTKVLIADGKSRRETEVDPNSGITLMTATTMTCKDNALLGHTTAFIDGQFLGIMDSKTTKSKKTLTTILEGSLFGRDVEDTINCE